MNLDKLSTLERAALTALRYYVRNNEDADPRFASVHLAQVLKDIDLDSTAQVNSALVLAYFNKELK